MYDSLLPHGLQHDELPCPPPTPRTYSNSCPFSQWCHPAISPSVIPFSSCLQSFPASGSFPISWLFISGDQSTGASASASVLPMNIQGWFPLGLTGLISLFMTLGIFYLPLSRPPPFPTVHGRKAMNNIDHILKSRDITLPTKVYLVKVMIFPVVMYGCES